MTLLRVALNREPTHFQKQTVANLQINHDLTDNLLLTAKVSYETRDFHQSGDQDHHIQQNHFWNSCCFRRCLLFQVIYVLVVKDNFVRLLIQKEFMISLT